MSVLRATVFSFALAFLFTALIFTVLYVLAPWNYAAVEQQIGDRYLAAHDYRGALPWYRDAAASNNATALFRLGYFYENGLGVARDNVESYKWYKRAISGSWAPAHRDFRGLVECSMATVERKMTTRQIAEADTRAESWKPRAGSPY